MLWSAGTSSVRFRPAGVSSYTHESTSAIGKPMIAATATSDMTHSGILSAGTNTLMASTIIQATIAYAIATRPTLRRLSSSRTDTEHPRVGQGGVLPTPRLPPPSTSQRARPGSGLQRRRAPPARAHPAHSNLAVGLEVPSSGSTPRAVRPYLLDRRTT